MGNTNVKPHPKPRNKKQLRWKGADRPSPPGKPSLLQENGFIPDVLQITWPKPDKDGGSTVTSYHVEHRRVGTNHWVKSSTFPITTNELAVNGLEPGWRYQFRVRAENAVGLSDPSEVSEPYTVTLQRSAIAAPKFTEELKDTVSLENGKVEFEVNYLGQPLPNICWFKDGFEIFSGNRTRITTVSDKSVLTILHATASDEGEIKCTATNRAGHSSTKCKLTIEAPPSIKLPKSYQDQDGIIFEIGETIKLNVAVTGRPTPLIFWSHDGESIQNDDRYEIEYNDKTAMVKIENALRSDRGEYQIKAVNKLGHDQASFLVTITDKPTPPGKPRVLLTSGKSVTLCWSTPKDDGGCRIGNYIIEYYRLGWDVWLKAATTRQLSTMLGDLIEGSQYKFRVKAESPYGVSEPSEESEVVFIPDLKRGIQEPSDVKQTGIESRIPLAKRRRANSTPRVSFVLDDGAPVRPERKKTGKTPEASPRLRRKQIPSFTKNGSDPHLNRKFSIPYSDSSMMSPSWKNSLLPNYPNNSNTGNQSPIPKVEKNKSPSPEIIVTDTDVKTYNDVPKKPTSPQRSPSKSPNFFDRTPWVSPMNAKSQPEESPLRIPNSLEKSPPISPNNPGRSPTSTPSPSGKSPLSSPNFQEESPWRIQPSTSSTVDNAEKSSPFERSPSRSPNHLQKSPPRSLPKSEELSRSSDRREEQFSRNDYFESRTKNNEVHETMDNSKKAKSQSPQNLDGIRPPLRQEFSGSSEFMLVLCPDEEQGTRFKRYSITFEENSIPPPLSLSAPELGFEPPEPSPMKRSASSTELLTYHLMERLHEAATKEHDQESYKANTNIPTIRVNSEPTAEPSNAEDKISFKRRLSGVLPGNHTSWSNRRYSVKNADETEDIFGKKLRKFEETEEMRREVAEYRKISESEAADDNDWMKDYEESITSEESDVSSTDQPRIPQVPHTQNEIEDDEEIYNPRNRMLSAVKADKDQPFEILTVRKNPPNSNIIPKPILKKSQPKEKESGGTSLVQQSRLEENQLNPRRNRSSSLSEALDDELDVSQIKTSPTPNKRRSFSLMPTQANFIRDAFKTKNQKKAEEQPSPKEGTAKNVSALANFTSIAGAGFIIPNEMQEKKETEEEAKVVVDFYGDIVKNFGGKSKPTAEFSRSIVSKYDTYEERKISEIKPNADTLASQHVRPSSPNYSGVEIGKPSGNQVNVETLARPSQIPTKSAPLPYKAPQIIPQMAQDYVPSTQKKEQQQQILQRGDFSSKLSRSSEKSPMRYYQEKGTAFNYQRTPRDIRRTGRPGTRKTSVGRRRKTPMSRDASTSPVRFSDDWDSQCSSKTSLEQDYYNRESLTSSRASSLSRRSLSPPKPKLRGITTQTSFRIDPVNPADSLERVYLEKKAKERMSFLFEYSTDFAMVSVAAWLYLFQNEYYAVPFIIIPIYRQLGQKIQKFNEAVKRRLPRWVIRRFTRDS